MLTFICFRLQIIYKLKKGKISEKLNIITKINIYKNKNLYKSFNTHRHYTLSTTNINSYLKLKKTHQKSITK